MIPLCMQPVPVGRELAENGARVPRLERARTAADFHGSINPQHPLSLYPSALHRAGIGISVSIATPSWKHPRAIVDGMAGEKLSRQQHPRRTTKEMDYDEKLKVLDEELTNFYQYCEQAGFSPAEMEVICSPLITPLRAAKLKKVVKVVVVSVVVLALLYGVAHTTTAKMHLTAVGRLLMIKMLPLWDWTSFFYESCLMTNPFYETPTFSKEDCVMCESLDRVDRIAGVSYERLHDNYLSRDAPVIVVDAMDTWPVMNTDDFFFDNITQIYLRDEKLIDSVPCILSSNLRTGSSDLHAFLRRIHNPAVEKWFVHWQNCDIYAVKALRRMYQRPYFLSSAVSPAHFNWVLMSSDYSTNIYKKVEPDSGLIMLSQLRGSTAFRLTPHKACNESCLPLTGTLQEGEILVFTNFIWSFEYYPGHNMDNVAILTETVWGENSM